MVTLSTLNANVKIAIITLNSKSYYKITKILRSQGFHFLSLTPDDKIPNSIKLVITTNSEKQLIPEINYLTVEELSNSKTHRYIIIGRLSSTGFNNITIGIDPGYRTGLSVYSENKQIYVSVCRSLNQIKKIVSEICSYFTNSNIVIKIGIGNKHNSYNIANTIKKSIGNQARIEIVNEFGTSNQKTKPNKRLIRDIKAAEIIAFRQGKIYH